MPEWLTGELSPRARLYTLWGNTEDLVQLEEGELLRAAAEAREREELVATGSQGSEREKKEEDEKVVSTDFQVFVERTEGISTLGFTLPYTDTCNKARSPRDARLGRHTHARLSSFCVRGLSHS